TPGPHDRRARQTAGADVRTRARFPRRERARAGLVPAYVRAAICGDEARDATAAARDLRRIEPAALRARRGGLRLDVAELAQQRPGLRFDLRELLGAQVALPTSHRTLVRARERLGEWKGSGVQI